MIIIIIIIIIIMIIIIIVEVIIIKIIIIIMIKIMIIIIKIIIKIIINDDFINENTYLVASVNLPLRPQQNINTRKKHYKTIIKRKQQNYKTTFLRSN